MTEKALWFFAGLVVGGVVLAALARYRPTRAQAVRIAHLLADEDDASESSSSSSSSSAPTPPAGLPPLPSGFRVLERPQGLAPFSSVSQSTLRLLPPLSIVGA